jgi:hypothetical protein
MSNYKVYHLKDGADKSFFLKPRPRFDQSIADAYCITKIQLARAEHEQAEKEVNVDSYMSHIARACKSHWDETSYLHVANVKAKDIVQAFRNTNNINGHWFLTLAKGVEVVTGETERNTSVGDVIEDVTTGDLFMVFGYTFLNINTCALID